MTDKDKSAEIGEVPFSFDELFFSRTDKSGIIQSCNSVFQRISQYDRAALTGKPHKIIRHPDMPRGVFWLFWETVKQGRPIGAYVKNRAKDGRHYWVYGIATPMDGGYLSVRLKPSSPVFAAAQDLYIRMLAWEAETRAEPRESAQWLLEQLAGMGFSGYGEFMSMALGAEVAARDAAAGREADPLITHFQDLTREAGALRQKTNDIFSSYENNRYVPLNLQVQSCQLGDAGRAIGVISSNYTSVSASMRTEVDNFTRAAHQVCDEIYDGQFLVLTAGIQAEVTRQFGRETGGGESDSSQEMAALEAQQNEYQRRAVAGLQAIAQRVHAFEDDCRTMKRYAASLEVIRVMGKVDAARITGQTGALNELIDDLKQFQGSIADSLMQVSRCNISMRNATDRVIATLAA